MLLVKLASSKGERGNISLRYEARKHTRKKTLLKKEVLDIFADCVPFSFSEETHTHTHYCYHRIVLTKTLSSVLLLLDQQLLGALESRRVLLE